MKKIAALLQFLAFGVADHLFGVLRGERLAAKTMAADSSAKGCGLTKVCRAKGSLCETDSPDTGEVARSARRGALSAKLTEGETIPLTAANLFVSPPPAPAGAPSQRGPLCLQRTNLAPLFPLLFPLYILNN